MTCFMTKSWYIGVNNLKNQSFCLSLESYYHFDNVFYPALTKVELTVEFFTVDNVEPVWYICHHVAHLKVEPLMMMVDVDVGV